jgi:hypothetical protein
MKKIITLIALIFTTSVVFGQLQTWNFDNSSANATTNATGVTSLPATFSVGTPSFVAGYVDPATAPGTDIAYASHGWSTNSTPDGSYFQLTVTASGDNLNFSGLELFIKRDTDGPKNVKVFTSVDNYANHIQTPTVVGTDFTEANVNLLNPAFQNLSSLIIRFYGYDAGDVSGLLIFDEIAFKTIGVLPVEMAAFTAEQNENTAALKWATYSEINNAYFEIEHSTDGREFTEIDFVEGAGNSLDYVEYGFVHENPATGKNYYRLRQVDFDGQFTYSEVVVVEFKTRAISEVKVFPNPVVEWVTIEMPTLDNEAIVTVFNVSGQLMKSEIISTTNNYLRIDVNDWTDGQYFIRIQTNDNQVITKQFVKF